MYGISGKCFGYRRCRGAAACFRVHLHLRSITTNMIVGDICPPPHRWCALFPIVLLVVPNSTNPNGRRPLRGLCAASQVESSINANRPTLGSGQAQAPASAATVASSLVHCHRSSSTAAASCRSTPLPSARSPIALLCAPFNRVAMHAARAQVRGAMCCRTLCSRRHRQRHTLDGSVRPRLWDFNHP